MKQTLTTLLIFAALAVLTMACDSPGSCGCPSSTHAICVKHKCHCVWMGKREPHTCSIDDDCVNHCSIHDYNNPYCVHHDDPIHDHGVCHCN